MLYIEFITIKIQTENTAVNCALWVNCAFMGRKKDFIICLWGWGWWLSSDIVDHL